MGTPAMVPVMCSLTCRGVTGFGLATCPLQVSRGLDETEIFRVHANLALPKIGSRGWTSTKRIPAPTTTLPLEALIATTYRPGGVSTLAVVVRTECAVPSTTRLTLVGLRAGDKPLGRTGKEEEGRTTVPMNPPTLEIRMALTTEEQE